MMHVQISKAFLISIVIIEMGNYINGKIKNIKYGFKIKR